MKRTFKYKALHWYEWVMLIISACALGMAVLPTKKHVRDMASLHQTLEQLRTREHQEIEKFWYNNVYLPMSMNDQNHEKHKIQRYWRKLFRGAIWHIQRYKNYLAKYPLDNQEIVHEYMIEQRQGYKLKAYLDSFVDTLDTRFAAYDLPKFYKIAEGNQNNPFYANNPWFRKKDFPHAVFENMTVAAALAMLTQKQLVLLRYGRDILKKIYWEDGFNYHLYRRITGIKTFTKSKYIQVGDSLNTDMFIDLRIPAYIPRGQGYYAEVNDQIKYPTKPVIPVAFRVAGKGQQHWIGKLHLCTRGKDTTITFKTPYWVK